MKKRLRNKLGQFTKHSKSEVSFVNLNSYTAPEIKEVVNKDFVEYGEDNNYFQYLMVYNMYNSIFYRINNRILHCSLYGWISYGWNSIFIKIYIFKTYPKN